MQKNHKVVLIIPALNEEKRLPLLLDSIKRQSFNDYEIIIADGGSKDNTVKIAKEYGCIVIIGGLVSVGRNNGAKVAKGDILLFLDADVVLPVYFLEKGLAEFEKNKLGIAGFTLFPLNGKKIDKIAFGIFNKWTLLTQKISPHGAVAIMSKKKVHDAIGGFDESIMFAEDYSYVRAAAKISKYKFIKEPFFTSIRRFDKDGRIKTYFKLFLSEFHVLFWGPVRSDIFKYRFDHYNEKK